MSLALPLSPAPVATPKGRSGKELLIATKEFTVERRRESWSAVLSTFALIAAVALAIVLLPFWTLRLPLAIFQGLLLVRAFCLFHDFQHGALLRDSPVARVLFFVYGELLLVPPSVWRETHNYHHAHNAQLVGSHIGSYAMLTPRMYQGLPKSQQRLYRFARHPLNIAAALLTVFALGMCVRPLIRAPGQHWQAGVSLLTVATLALACGWTGHLDAFVFAWLVPLAIATATGAYLFYAQHNFPAVQVAPRETWSFTSAALESSSHMRMGPAMNWLTANIGFHHVHHLNSAIPFYRLPEAMAAIPELQHPGVTSWQLGDVVACLRLKLWDPERHSMTGFR